MLYNYAVALQLHDYERAYGYLAEKDNKPTYNTFYQAFLTRQLDTSNSALQIGNVQMLAERRSLGECYHPVCRERPAQQRLVQHR